jgi:hypothetical protein
MTFHEACHAVQNRAGTMVHCVLDEGHTGPHDYGDREKHTVEIGYILDEALAIYEERSKLYGDQWRKYGWRGCLYNARRKVERAWEHLWNRETERPTVHDDVDDLLDTINYCAMAIKSVREGNRDGKGGWWNV